MSVAEGPGAEGPGAEGPGAEGAGHLEVAGLVKRFGDFTALDRVSLTATRGELLTLVGPSGCGKTTLLRAIAGFQTPDAGRIVLGGRPLEGVPPERRNFGMVFQSYAIFPHLSVAENVAYGLASRGIKGAAAAPRVQAALEAVQLGHLAARFPDALSGGQKQRVGLARAMVIQPDLLLMDEPLSNLDAKLRIEMRSQIRRMQRDAGITTIYVTHDQEEALAISDRIAVMERGRILQLGTPRAVFEAPSHAFVAEFIGGCTWFAGEARDGALHLDAGVALPMPGLPAGQLRAALRSEDLSLAADGPALEGRVELLSYLGHRTRVTLRLATGATLDADLPSDAALPAEGSTARLGFDPARLRLFGADGARIA